MSDKPIEICVRQFRKHALPGGGFAARPKGGFRSDATAWAILALSSAGYLDDPLLPAARQALVAQQMEDGRVPNIKAISEAYWPTGLALLAWHGDGVSSQAAARAVEFLLKTKSFAIPYTEAPGADQDTSLIGWPWVLNTYAWLVPTAYAVIALKAHGREGEKRVTEACRLILNRQIPSGGWNYGDTFEFGTELLPFPDTTGVGLVALRGLCSPGEVAKSLDYLEGCISGIHTPLSLSWGILGLTVWDRRPSQSEAWIEDCILRQDFYGAYDTEQLALLCLAWEGTL